MFVIWPPEISFHVDSIKMLTFHFWAENTIKFKFNGGKFKKLPFIFNLIKFHYSIAL